MPISVRVHRITRGVFFLILRTHYPVYFSDGTTDVTRTMHFGTPTNKQKVLTNFNSEIEPVRAKT